MVISDIASLSFHSETRPASDVTAALAIEPTTSHEIGDPRTTASGRPSRFDHPWPTSHWGYTITAPEDADSGVQSLREMLQVFRGKAEGIDSLRADFDVRLCWSGMSNSSQGGFVFDVELLRDLAALGCDLFGTVFASDDEEENPAAGAGQGS